jgi:hypothetical protein
LISLSKVLNEIPALSSARSVTLILHGVGSTTDRRLLAAAAKGYAASGLGGRLHELTLTECPSLSLRQNGVEALALETPSGPHFVLALPWADRRIRLSAIAKSNFAALVAFAALTGGGFALREELARWFPESWSHIILVYLTVLTVGVLFGFVVWVITGADPRAASPDGFYPRLSLFLFLFYPSFLALTLTFFLDPTWLWAPSALIAFALWFLPTVTAIRCFRMAKALGWRLALICLIAALVLLAGVLVRSAKESNVRFVRESNRRAEVFQYVAGSRTLGIPAGLLPSVNPVPAPQPLGKAESADDYERRFRSGKHDPVHLGDLDPLRLGDLGQGPSNPVPDPASIKSAITNRGRPLRAILRGAAESIKFYGQLEVIAGLMVVCLVAMAFSWVVDFPLDVLQYAGHPKARNSLIEGTIRAVRWLNDQAPAARLIIVGHSLGSVIASEAVAGLCSGRPPSPRVVLVTLGSPLNYLNRVLPESFRGVPELSRAICGYVRWVNLWRRSDYVGKQLDIEANCAVQGCVGSGRHPNYWTDGNVWRAVARHTFTELPPDDGLERSDARAIESSVLERRLGMLVLLAIGALALSTIALSVVLNP